MAAVFLCHVFDLSHCASARPLQLEGVGASDQWVGIPAASSTWIQLYSCCGLFKDTILLPQQLNACRLALVVFRSVTWRFVLMVIKEEFELLPYSDFF